MKPFPKLRKKVFRRTDKLTRGHLWVIIGILFLGHLLWISWLVYTEFYIIPRATITRNQDELYQREVEDANKFVPSYSFYDSWGNISGELDATELGLVFRAEIVRGIGTDIKIYVEKDGNEQLLTTIKGKYLEDADRISWNDLIAVVNSNEFIVRGELEDLDGEFIAFWPYDKDLKPGVGYASEYKYRLGEATVRSMFVEDDNLYFIAQTNENSREIMRLNLETSQLQMIYSEKTTPESDKYVSDVRLTGVFMEKYLVYEKVFHFGNTFNYSQTAVDIETGESDLFTSDTVKGIY